MTSGELLKYRKGLFIATGYVSLLSGSSQFSLTLPGVGLRFAVDFFVSGDMFCETNMQETP